MALRQEPGRAVQPTSEFLGAPRRRLAAEMSGIGIRYDLGDGHPSLERRMADLDLITATDSRRVFSRGQPGLGDALTTWSGAPAAA